MFVVSTDKAHPGSSTSCAFRRDPQFHPRIQVGRPPVSDSTGGHMTQAGPANYSSLDPAQPLVQELASHSGQMESPGDFS